MNVFYCTRCGVRLQLDDLFAGRAVSCPRCAAVVRSPAITDTIPFAKLAEPTDGLSTFILDEANPNDVAIDDLADAVVETELNRLPTFDDSDGSLVSTGSAEAGSATLDYATHDSFRRRAPRLSPVTVATIAERLSAVESDEPTDASSMSNCPYCDSTIAPFLGKCPFCRHPLRGR